eukprot:TRINITY_DN3493_c0_g1_i1.p1 TRINITY_DN3493_c0_g1~~TRINITY_DN3493_c0_g1_i1.p1  ORF type:complete len:509 (-),score=76.54 TRINITY_DN3493_c0_g1_i1:49-1575(-)
MGDALCEDCLFSIFSFLDIVDRFPTRFVSKRWNRAERRVIDVRTRHCDVISLRYYVKIAAKRSYNNLLLWSFSLNLFRNREAIYTLAFSSATLARNMEMIRIFWGMEEIKKFWNKYGADRYSIEMRQIMENALRSGCDIEDIKWMKTWNNCIFSMDHFNAMNNYDFETVLWLRENKHLQHQVERRNNYGIGYEVGFRGNWDNIKRFQDLENEKSDKVLRGALDSGNIEIAKRLVREGYVPNEEGDYYDFGSLEAAKYAIEELKVPTRSDRFEITNAAKKNNVELVFFLRDHGLQLHDHWKQLMEFETAEVLMFMECLLKEGFTFVSEFLVEAGIKGNLQVVQWLVEHIDRFANRDSWNPHVINRIAKHFQWEVVKFLIESGCPFSPENWPGKEYAFMGADLDTLKWFNSLHNFNWDSKLSIGSAYWHFARRKDRKILKWLKDDVKVSFHTDAVCSTAMWDKDLSLLQWAYSEGFPLVEYNPRLAIRLGYKWMIDSLNIPKEALEIESP